MFLIHLTTVIAFFTFFFLVGCSTKPPYAETKLTWEEDIRPIFEASCIECHGGSMIRKNLSLKDPDQIRKNIWKIYKVVIVNQKMPPKNDMGIFLSEADRIKINQWIRGNAPGIGTGKPY
ncbi:MAG: cytochrome c [bacterium]|nr:cytochrome c [bacterium]